MAKVRKKIGARWSFFVILNQEIDKDKYGSFFPSLSIESEKNNLIGSRLAWCYGDLGIASVLLQAGNILKNNTYRNKALDILLYAALNRRNLKENMVVDAGLCHGTAGLISKTLCLCIYFSQSK